MITHTRANHADELKAAIKATWCLFDPTNLANKAMNRNKSLKYLTLYIIDLYNMDLTFTA